VSPGETAPQAAGLRGADHENMLKYCGDELDLKKSRTLLNYHPVEVARQNGAGGARRLFCSCDRAS
jgi:hypothetical protein